MNEIIPVTFHGDTLALVNHEGEPFLPMKPVVENMGLAWQVQQRKLTEKFGAVITIMVTTGGDGKQYEMLCLPLRKFPAWVYSINPNKVKPELRAKIVSYQEECDDVLWKYWTQGFAERPGVKRPSVSQQLSAHGVLLRLSDKLEAERHPVKRGLIKEQLEHACRILGVTVPNLDAIGHAEEPQAVPAIVDAFWEAVEMIGLEKLNHARVAGTVAINLLHFQKVADQSGIKAPPLEPLRRVLRLSESPRFRAFKSVNSGLLDRSVKCWVFEEEAAAPLSPLN